MTRLLETESGERMALFNWARSPANVWKLSADTIRKRLTYGYSLAQALGLAPGMKRAHRHPDSDVATMLGNSRLSLTDVSRLMGRSRDEVKELAYGKR